MKPRFEDPRALSILLHDLVTELAGGLRSRGCRRYPAARRRRRRGSPFEDVQCRGGPFTTHHFYLGTRCGSLRGGPLAAILGQQLSAVGPAAATTVYADGGTHTIDFASDDLWIENATTVKIVSGGSVTAPNGGFAGAYAIVSWASCVVEVFDGTIRAGDGTGGGGAGIYATGAMTKVTGGSVVQGSTVSIGGASFRGGVGSVTGGYGVSLWNCPFDISSGTIMGGSGLRGAPALCIRGSSNGTIHGGQFQGAVSLEVFEGGRATVTGGEFSGRWEVVGDAKVDVFGRGLRFLPGGLIGTLADGTPIAVVLNVLNSEVILHDVTSTEPTSWSHLKSLYRPD